MTSSELPEQIFSPAQQEWIWQLIEAHQPPPPPPPPPAVSVSSSQEQPATTSVRSTSSSTSRNNPGNLGKLFFAKKPRARDLHPSLPTVSPGPPPSYIVTLSLPVAKGGWPRAHGAYFFHDWLRVSPLTLLIRAH